MRVDKPALPPSGIGGSRIEVAHIVLCHQQILSYLSRKRDRRHLAIRSGSSPVKRLRALAIDLKIVRVTPPVIEADR